MNKHMTYEERLLIEQALDRGLNLSETGEYVGKHRSTIGREIRAHRLKFPAAGNDCIHRDTCDIPKECTAECPYKVRKCRSTCRHCISGCERYEPELCRNTVRAPYVCNGCEHRRNCRLTKWMYIPGKAQMEYEFTLKDSREGINLTEDELYYVDDLISPLLRRGQSVNVVCHEHRDELPVSARTVYTYIDSGLLNAKNIDLARKVRRPYQKKRGPVLKVDKQCHIGRTYADYLKYREEHPEKTVVQGDSVEGVQGRKVLLTLFFTNCDLQLAFIRDHNNAASVSAVFERLRRILGPEDFKTLFQIILVDRGSEFTDPDKIEVDQETGEKQCRVFYCDPQNSNQKAGCEKNHELIRYISPKGKTMDHLNQDDIDLMMSHINSYPREKWNWKSPLDIFTGIYGESVTTTLGLQRIDPKSIILKPELLKK